MKDSLFVYEYLRFNIPRNKSVKIYFWAHSLGCGVCSHLTTKILFKNYLLNGIILESPFFNIYDEIKLHPFSYFFPYNPILDEVVKYSLDLLNIHFRNDLK